MKLIAIPTFFFLVAASPLAFGTVFSYGVAAQPITITGLGPNASGIGVGSYTWGSCVFDGTNTTCTVSAPLTAPVSGTIAFVLTYPGNGPSTLTAPILSPSTTGPGNVSNGSFVTTITESNGTILTLYGLPFYSLQGYQCTGVSQCDQQHVALIPNATITGMVSGSFDATPQISGAISASAFGAFTSIAPGTWMEIYGFDLSTILPSRTWGGADFNGNNAPTELGGTTTTVTVGGQPAFIDYVNWNQVNVQVPSGVAAGRQAVVVTTAGGSSLPYTIQVNPIEPGFLSPSAFQLSAGQYIVALFPDGVTYVLPPGITSAVPTKRAKPGDTIMFYGVGFGPVTPNIPAGQIVQQSNSLQSPLQVSFAGTPATVNYDGLVATYVGLYQFNVIVPSIAASDAVPVTFSIGTTPITLQSLIIAVAAL